MDLDVDPGNRWEGEYKGIYNIVQHYYFKIKTNKKIVICKKEIESYFAKPKTYGPFGWKYCRQKCSYLIECGSFQGQNNDYIDEECKFALLPAS